MNQKRRTLFGNLLLSCSFPERNLRLDLFINSLDLTPNGEILLFFHGRFSND